MNRFFRSALFPLIVIVLLVYLASQTLIPKRDGETKQTYSQLMAAKPAEAVRKSITGMLPHNRLGRQMATKLKVYAGPNHPHAAQQPTTLDLADARRVEA